MAKRVLIVGGIGRLEARYRTLAEKLGLDLIYCERRLPGEDGASRWPEVAAVVVITSVCSHVLLKSARQRAAASRCKVRYVAQPSISAIQRALSEIAEVRCAA